MSDYIDTREGWRELDEKDFISSQADRFTGWFGGVQKYFVREEPVPPLPTEPYTVIWVNWKDGDRPKQYALIDGKWGVMTPEELAAQMHSFFVLAEPRAVTAKAFLDRVKFWTAPEAADRQRVTREFGVES